MADTKYPIIRYQTLNRCFRDKYKRYYIEDLIEACSDAVYEYSGKETGCSRRTILDDIRFMESEAGWSIELEEGRDGHRRFYRYVDTDFSINETVLTESEYDKLNQTIQLLEKFKGLPSFQWVDDLLIKLQSGFRKSSDIAIEFEHAPSLKGVEHFDQLFHSIVNKQVLVVTYKTFKGLQKRWTIHPYLIKQYNSRWFLFGKNTSLGGKISNLPLDRIENLTDSREQYIPDDGMLQRLLNNVVGVTITDQTELVAVQLKFSPERFPYVVTKKIHHSQTILDENERIIQISVIPNKELEALLLQYGNDVEVLAPASLRQQMKEKIDKMAKIY